MGLLCGEHGVKNLVKATCADAVRDFESLAAVVEATGCSPNEAVVLLDGNVLVRQVPMSITDFKEYARIFERFVANALDAADHVLVVFDEPDKLTVAKLEEQIRRDRQHKKKAVVCSADLHDLIPKTDNYTLEQMLQVNPHDLMAHRGARNRLFDALCKRAMISLFGRLEAQNKVLLFDGIDGRGADRGVNVAREAGMFSNHPGVEELLRRAPGDSANGEGDVKLTELECEIQYLRNTGRAFHDVQLVIVSTIDTDSIAIELMAQSARNQEKQERPELPDPVTTLLCFREKHGKRGEPGDDGTKVSYACIDIESAHEQLCKVIEAPSQLQRHAMVLLCGGWVLSKSDFVEMKGLRPDVVLMAAKQICADNDRAKVILSRLRHTWTLTSTATFKERTRARAQITKSMVSLVGRAHTILGNMPRMQRASASVKSALDLELAAAPLVQLEDGEGSAFDSVPSMLFARAAFVLVYWNGLQPQNAQIGEWGFTLAHNLHSSTLSSTTSAPAEIKASDEGGLETQESLQTQHPAGTAPPPLPQT
jgi:hypothetical protein